MLVSDIQFYKLLTIRTHQIQFCIVDQTNFMQNNQQIKQSDYQLNDIVFALKTNKQVWPAKIIKMLSENTFQVKFYMLRRHIKASRDQIWPLNSQTCQRFITQNSTSFFRKVVQMAKKHIQKQAREETTAPQSEVNPEQEQLNRSFMLQNVNFEVESSHLQIPFSQKRGLFVIDELNSSLQISQENSCPQYLQNESHSKRQANKGKHEVQLIALQKQKEDTGRRYQTRFQMRKKNRRTKKASLIAQKQKPTMQQFDNPKFEVGESIQQISHFINPEIQQPIVQENTDQFIPLEYTHTHALPDRYENIEIQHNSHEQNHQQSNHSYPQVQNTQQVNYPQENNQNLVFFGPIDIVDLSTQASFHSIHTIPAQQGNSTMASSNDISHNQSDKQNQPHFRFEHTHSQSNLQDQSSDSEDSIEANVKPNQQELIYTTILQCLLKLTRVVEGECESLKPEEQLKLSRSLQAFRQTQINKSVLQFMVEFVTLFEESISKNKQKCYIQYTLIKSHIQIIALLNKSQPQSSHQPQIIDMLESYQSRRQTIK